MILVTGATGNTGRELVRRLSAQGARVRAMARRDPEEALPGVEYVRADFDDPLSLQQALLGVNCAFLVTNSSDRVEAQQLRFVEIARVLRVRHIVYLSQLHASKDSPVRFLRYHAAIEEAIRSSGMAYTHLRPNLFMQGLLQFRQLIAQDGRFFAPAGDACVSAVDVRDVAEVAAAALTCDAHQGKTFDLTGPEALTHGEMATQLSESLGKPVAFTDLPEAAVRAALIGFGMPEWQADGLIEDYAHYRRGEAADLSTAVADITGNAPRSFAAFARDYRDQFLAVARHA